MSERPRSVSAMDAFRLPERLAARLPGRLGELGDRRVVSLVRLHGVITPASGPVPRSVINAAAVEKTLERAFAPEGLVAVGLQINSPGGAATQSALVADRICGLAQERGVPVLAFCEDVAASGGYWLACAADEIYAHATSIVGSIGVISQGFGLDKMIERFGRSDAIGGLLAVPPQSAFHCVNLGEGDAISSISTLTEMPLWENGGYLMFRPEIFDHVEEDCDLIGDVCAPLAKEGRMMAYRHRGFWQPADTVKERNALEAAYQSGTRPWMLWDAPDRDPLQAAIAELQDRLDR